jgi:hypothetical protein
MKTVTFISGKFTDNGNFSGYNASGERFHVPGRAMESISIKKGDTIKFPIYALVVERTFNVLDEQGNPKEGETFTRQQAGSVFTTEQAMFDALNGDKLLSKKAEADYKAKASVIGLTEEAINALQSVA